ncbi:MAG: hypothetical protein ACTSRZ_21380 [Promethearchaeota archaeon]
MKKINVIDLDKTLIPFDSFKKYILTFIKKGKILLILLIILRKLRILSLVSFKKYVTVLCRKSKNYDAIMNQLAINLYEQIDKDIYEKVMKYSDNNTINILSTASLEDFANRLAKMLGWECISTSVSQNYIVHNYADNKIKNLKKRYPRSKYIYNFSISDDKKDINLLNLFKFYELRSDD